jgi:hypothetical protein
MLLSFIALATLAITASAHATFQELWVNGVDQGGYCVRLPQSNNPVTDVTSNVRIRIRFGCWRTESFAGYSLQRQRLPSTWEVRRKS